MTSRNRDFFDLNAHQRPMVGDTKISALSIDHLGWLVCDGRLLNVSNYQFLFDVIGYSFGSNETGSQFMLPNPAGRVPGFIGSGTNLTTRGMGSNVGEETHTLTIAEMPTHNHGTDASDSVSGNNSTGNSATGITVNNHTTGITTQPHNHSYTTSQSGGISGSGLVNFDVNNTAATTGNTTVGINDAGHIHAITDPTHYHSIASQGGSNAHNNMQPTLFLGNLFMYCGKFSLGSYPFTQGTNLV